MTDAVERIRRHAQNEATYFALRDMLKDREAEIERLQAAIARQKESLTDHIETNIQLRKEVAALTIPGEVRVDPEYFQKLRKIEEAARNLLSVKGRHHTEQAYKRLEDSLK